MTCEKLFSLLRAHLADQPMCIVIILIINAAADMLSKDLGNGKKIMSTFQNYREHKIFKFVDDKIKNIIDKVIEHIEIVRPYPKLLHRLINIINITKFKNDAAYNEVCLIYFNF